MKIRKKVSLKNSIFNICGIMLVVTIILYLIGANSMLRIINKEMDIQNEVLIDFMVDQIQDTVELPLDLIKNVNSMINDQDTLDGEIVTRYLETIQKSYSYFTDIHIIDRDGYVVNTAPYDKNYIGYSVVNEPFYLKGSSGQETWSEVYISSLNGNPTLSASILYDNYMIVVDLDLLSLPITLDYGDRFNNVKEILILDQWGTYIVANDYNAVESRLRYHMFDEMDMSNNSEIANFNNKFKIGYKKIEELNWYVIFEFDYSDVYKELYIFVIELFLVWLVLGVFVTLNLKKYFKQVNEELGLLQNRANIIIKNETAQKNHHIDLKFKEFSELNYDFSLMLEKIEDRENEIKKINLNLEETVVERTKDLNASNKKLKNEIQERKKIEEKIKSINENLDQQVKERTEQLVFLNSVLERSVIKAEEANDAKTRFLSVMSHEMRTPLNGIMGFLQLLEATDLSNGQNEIIVTIKNSSKMLLNLINEILDVEKYAAGKMIFNEENVVLKDCFKETLNHYELLAKNKGLYFDLNFHNDMNFNVNVDKTKLNQLIGNLLSNALKFTSVGGIKLTLKSITNSSEVEVFLTISDTGIGIKEEVKPYLFSPFTQADASIASSFGGTGLGLTICKEIVNYYHGSIDYQSTYGRGTTFHIQMTLPTILDLKNTIVEEAPEEISINKLQKVNSILVVEDNLVNLKLVVMFIEKYDIYYEIAMNGLEAVEKTLKHHFDLILMDCQMPVMDGFEATKNIRQHCKDTKIIAMTAYSSDAEKMRCLDSGMDEVITKPIDLEKLSTVFGVEKLKYDKKNSDESGLTIYDVVNKLQDLLKFDFDSCLEIINTYISQVSKAFIEIDNCLMNRDYVTLKNLMHQLKGASGAVHIDELWDMFERTEKLIEEDNIDEFIFIINRIKSNKIFAL